MTFNKTSKSLLACSILLATSQAHSASFQLQESSVTGLGRAFAGDAAIADNASVLQRNPAAMAMFDSPELSAGLTYIKPNVDIKGVTNSFPGGSASDLDASGVAPAAFVPNFYYIHPVNDQVAVGLGIFSNFGLKTEFPDDYAAGSTGGQSSLETVTFNPSVSYRLNEQFSFGLGLNAVYGKAGFTRRGGDLAKLDPRIPSATTKIIDMQGDTWGYGWNIGTLWEINDVNRLALSYRSKTKMEFKDDFTGTSSAYKPVPAQLDLNLPDTLEFAGYHKLTSDFAMHYSVHWFGWSSFEKLEAVGADGSSLFLKEEKYENSYRLAIGGTYDINQALALRAGVAFDKSPVKEENRSISIPDSDRYWFSLGATYAFNQALDLDFGLTYINSKEVSIKEKLSESASYPYAANEFSTTGNVFIAGVQLNYHF